MGIKLLTCATTYLVIILCELGDKTQVAVLLLTSQNPRKRWLLFLASALALSLCVLVEVSIGARLSHYISPAAINKLAGLVFLLLGVIGLWQEFGASKEIIAAPEPEIYEKAS